MPIQKKYLRLHKLAQKYKKKKGGQDVHDLKRLWKREPLIQKLFPCGDQADRLDLAKLLDRLDGAIKKGYLRLLDSKNHLRGYKGAREIFGNIEGKRGYNNLVKEITKLILSGEDLKSHSRRLQRDYNEKKEIIEGSKETEGLWDWVKKDLASLYEKMSPEEIKQYKVWILS